MRARRMDGPALSWAVSTAVAVVLVGILTDPAAAQPTVVEPGYTVTYVNVCGRGYYPIDPANPNNPFTQGQVNAAACTPGGPWGDFLYLSIYTPWDDHGSYVERVTLDGSQSDKFVDPGGGLGAQPTWLGFSPLGWRSGDLLFVRVEAPYPYDPASYRLYPFYPTGVSAGVIEFSPDEPGSHAVDPTGAYGGDLFVTLHGTSSGIYRVDAAGNVTPFSPLPGGRLRFGPGGPWGTDLWSSAGGGVSIAPDGTATPLPGGFGFQYDWAFGPGFEGDMFSSCGSGDLCRIRPDGTRSVFATGVNHHVAFCGGSLWLGLAGCYKITPLVVAADSEISPSSLSVKASGTVLSIRTFLWDSSTWSPMDASLMSPAYISRVYSPTVGEIVLPVPRAEPGCDVLTEDGIWETTEARVLHGDGTLTLRFSEPSDGQCETMDGDRQDIIALLLDVPHGETAMICYTSSVPGAIEPFESCAPVLIANSGVR